MVKHVTRATIQELDRIRLVCQKCEAVLEIPTAELCANKHIDCCASCGQSFFAKANENPILLLDLALTNFKNNTVKVAVEFEWPEDK